MAMWGQDRQLSLPLPQPSEPGAGDVGGADPGEAAPGAPPSEGSPICSPELLTPTSKPQGHGEDRDQKGL